MLCAVKEKLPMFQSCIVAEERKYASHCWRKACPLIRYALQTDRTMSVTVKSWRGAVRKEKDRKGCGRVEDDVVRRG